MDQIDPISKALSDVIRVPGAAALTSMVALLDAMSARYSTDMLDAKAEDLPRLQAYAKQVRALRRSITDFDSSGLPILV